MEQLIDFHAPEVQAVLDTLLKDKSTGKNIIWATDPPEELQTVMYEPVTDRSQITTQQLGLTHYEVVLPRMMKQTDTQQQRTRKKGEVFSPAWVCNKMNNALDADWFRGLGAEESAGQFTVELPQGWNTVETPVQFPVCKGRMKRQKKFSIYVRKIPTLVIGSYNDQCVILQAVKDNAKIHTAELKIVDSVCHDMMLDPDWRNIADLIFKFIEKTIDKKSGDNYNDNYVSTQAHQGGE